MIAGATAGARTGPVMNPRTAGRREAPRKHP